MTTRWQREGLPLSEEVEARLRALYATGKRAYHNAQHVDEVLQRFDEARVEMQDPRVPYYALLFHDCVYVPGRKDNEEKSAEAFIGTGLVPDVASKVAAVILATARHGKLTPQDVDDDTALALDCDMAILGASPERFDAYDAQIADEYAGIVTGLLYSVGRKRFLKGLLEHDRIYLSDFFHRRYDRQARANLRSALEKP